MDYVDDLVTLLPELILTELIAIVFVSAVESLLCSSMADRLAGNVVDGHGVWPPGVQVGMRLYEGSGGIQ